MPKASLLINITYRKLTVVFLIFKFIFSNTNYLCAEF
jgi:hypothetical protein